MRVSLSDYREEITEAYESGMTLQRIADLFGVTDEAIRWVIGAETIAMIRRQRAEGHGTDAGYTRGCRCRLCRAAHRAYNRGYSRLAAVS